MEYIIRCMEVAERGEKKMTDYEKGIIYAALVNYEIAIKDELTQQDHTQEEVEKAFEAWNMTTKLIKKYGK